MDFAAVIDERDLAPAYQQMQDSLRTGSTIDPWTIANGKSDALFIPSHLASQGFFLLRART